MDDTTPPRDDVTVRNLRPDDLEALIALDAKVVGRRRDEFLKLKLRQTFADSGIAVSLAAEVDGRLVGFLLARVYYGEFGVTERVAALAPRFARIHADWFVRGGIRTFVTAEHRAKAVVCFQSCGTRRALAKTHRHLRALMVGHLRDEKDPRTYIPQTPVAETSTKQSGHIARTTSSDGSAACPSRQCQRKRASPASPFHSVCSATGATRIASRSPGSSPACFGSSTTRPVVRRIVSLSSC